MQAFHLIIGEFHADDTPIRVASRFYQSLMEKNPDAKVAVCLEMTQESPAAIMKYISNKKSLSDALYAAAEAKSDLEALSKVTANQLAALACRANPLDIKKSIMMDLLCRDRVLAYEQCCSAWVAGGALLKGIDFAVIPGTALEMAVQIRSMYMLEQLKALQDEGYFTIFIVGQQHLIDLKQFMQSPEAPQLSNCHFFSVMSSGSLPFVTSDLFSESVQKFLSTQKTAIENTVVPKTFESISKAEISMLTGNSDEVVLKATIALAVFYKERGNKLFKEKNYSSALIAYQTAETFDPTYKEAILNQGTCLNQLGRLELALERFEKALSLDPHYERAAYYQASAFYRLSRFKPATAIINANIGLPDRKETWAKLREQILEKEKEACRAAEALIMWGRIFEARDEIARWSSWSTLAEWDELKQACRTQPRMIKALQDSVVRFDRDTPPYINGICTDDLQICIGVIHYNPIKKQGSLIHLSCVENFDRAASIEQAWIGGEEFPPVIVYNGDHARTREREEFFKMVTERGWETHDSRTGCVFLSRDGILKVEREALDVCENAVLPPNSAIRVNICHLSGCIKAYREMPIDYQFINNEWQSFEQVKVADIFKYVKTMQGAFQGCDLLTKKDKVRNWFFNFCATTSNEKFGALISRYKNHRNLFSAELQEMLYEHFFILMDQVDFTEEAILTNQVTKQLSEITGSQFSVDRYTDGSENATVYLVHEYEAARLRTYLESQSLAVSLEKHAMPNKTEFLRVRILNSHDPLVIEKVNALFERHKAFCMSPLLTTTPMAAAHSAAGAAAPAAPAVKIDEPPIPG